VEFQERVMNSLMETEYKRIVSGSGSAIDEYMAHRKIPLFIVNVIDFKEIDKSQQTHFTLSQKKAVFKERNEKLSERFLLIVNVKNEKSLKAIKDIYPQKGGKIILIKNSAIRRPILNENLLHFFKEQFKDSIVKKFVEDGDIIFFRSFKKLIEGLEDIFNDNHKKNLRNLVNYHEDVNVIRMSIYERFDMIFLMISRETSLSINEKRKIQTNLREIFTALNEYGFKIRSDVKESYFSLNNQLNDCVLTKISGFYRLKDIRNFNKLLDVFHINVLEILNNSGV